MLKSSIKENLNTILYKKAYTRAVFTVWGLALKEFRMSFYQFFTFSYPISSFFRSIKYAIIALLRIPLGRSIRLSYSFTGEDRIIESLLKPLVTYNGFYVDVGCNDPRFISNTFLLYRRGWKGICIDANEKLIKKYKKIRPRDKAVCALVSDEKKEMEFVELTNNTLSSTNSKHLKQWMLEGQNIISKKTIFPKTLTSILDDHKAPYNIDLLSVDVEENDLNVLQSLDFAKYHPRLIIVEAETFDPRNPSHHPIYNLLTQKNYKFNGSILTNLYFSK